MVTATDFFDLDAVESFDASVLGLPGVGKKARINIFVDTVFCLDITLGELLADPLVVEAIKRRVDAAAVPYEPSWVEGMMADRFDPPTPEPEDN